MDCEKRQPLGLKECQSVSLDILLYFDAFCRDRGLRYALAYGTLLGAVRHGGYIPWDDDIDLFMDRKTYEQMIKTFSDPCGRYRCISFEQDTYYLPYAKIVDTRTEQFPDNTKPWEGLGVGIDVFPLDTFPGERQQILKAKKRACRLTRAVRYTMYPDLRSLNGDGFLPVHSAFYLMCRLLGRKFFARKLRRCIERMTGDGIYCGIAAATDADAYRLYDPAVFQGERLYAFEGHMLPSFADADAYLRQTYGDYMQLPEESQRIPHLAASYMKQT